jgi:DNA-binding transcriptional ArsR family regulator
MEEGQDFERDRQRAEIFDALGHPTRITILKALNEEAIGFADLKKKTGIDSGGHLQHHLTKLNGLIKTDEYGKYCLSDQGKDALLTVRTVENATDKKPISQEKSIHRFNFKIGLKPVALLLVALLIASSTAAVYEYNQAGVFQSRHILILHLIQHRHGST